MVNEKELNNTNLFDRMLNGFSYLAGFMVLFQAVSVSVDVIMRYFFHRPITGVLALNEWSLLFITFLGAAWLQKKRGHVKMDILIQRFNPKLQAVFEISGYVIGLIVSLTLFWFGTVVTWENFLKHTYDFYKIKSIPLAIILLVIPVGSGLLALQLLRDIKEIIVSKRS